MYKSTKYTLKFANLKNDNALVNEKKNVSPRTTQNIEFLFGGKLLVSNKKKLKQRHSKKNSPIKYENQKTAYHFSLKIKLFNKNAIRYTTAEIIAKYRILLSIKYL